MAANIKRCDVCGKETDAIVAKLYLAPVIPGKTRVTATHYNRSLDIGNHPECVKAVHALGNWTKRRTREEYNGDRRLRAGAPVAAGNSSTARSQE